MRGKKASHGMAELFDAPSTAHPSIWPEKSLTKDSPVAEIISRLPDYTERAREALCCIESRAARAAGGVSGARKAKLESIAADARAWLSGLTVLRRDIDALIEDMKTKSEPDESIF